MKDDYFVPSFGNKPRNLVGRENIMSKFEECLNSVPGSRDRALVMLGQRGAGKTVLLLELAQMATEKGFVVALPTVVSKEMPVRVVEKLISSSENVLKNKKSKISGGSINMFGFGAGIQMKDDNDEKKSFSQKLNEICKEINKNGNPVLILIDELQANNEELKQLIIAYQEMVGEGIDVALVMAGLPGAVSSVLNEHVLTFINRSTKIELEPLRQNDIEIYYIKAFNELGINIDNETIKKAARQTEGSPYMMQLIGHYITILSDDSGVIDKDNISRALSMAEDDYQNDICKTTLATLSEKDILFLKAMSKDGEESEVNDIAERIGVSNQYIQIYKKRLIQAGVINQPSRGKVRIVIPYLKEYLAKGEEYIY